MPMARADHCQRLRGDATALAAFCARWKTNRLDLLGSAMRDDFRDDSDVDVLVTFAPDTDWGLFDHQQMEEELSAILRRAVDLVSRRAVARISNPIRRRTILATAQPLYVAG